MIRRILLFSVLLVVPVIGFGVALAIQAHFNSEIRTVLRQQYPEATEEKLTQVTLDFVCEQANTDIRDLCNTNRNLNLMRQGALGAGIVGLSLLLIIRLAGILTRNSRFLLAAIFKPGLYLTAIVLTGLILVHAALVIAAIYYGESVLINRIHVGVIFAVGLGAAIGILAMVRSIFSLVKKAETIVVGRTLSHDEAPLLWKHIGDTADRIGALRPQHLVLGLDPNFFVTEANVVCLSGKLTGRTLYCSLPLCRILNTDEMTSVIGHELGHFKGLDTKYSKRFYPIYRGAISSLASLQAASSEGASGIALLPALVILHYFLESFSIAENRLSRERELAADQTGAMVTNPKVVATALVKVHAFAGLWDELQQIAIDTLKEGKLFVNPSKAYAEACGKSAVPESLEGIVDKHLIHPTDSHPALSLRLQSLQINIEEVSGDALAVIPTEAAISYIPDYEKKEEEISQAYQLILARNLGINLEQAVQNQDK